MKLEQQCCSLELAKKLKELGVKQESYFYWLEYKSFPVKPWQLETKESLKNVNYPEKAISAFTVAELGEMLPWRIEAKGFLYTLYQDKGGKPWYWVDYRNGESTYTKFDILAATESDTEADARAKMLVYLIENKLV